MARLEKQLGSLDVFAVAAGAMISSGLFVLPAIAYAKAGPAVILSYLAASLLIVPSVLCKAELATAMPRAGGTYFFVERSLGSMIGLFSGVAGWLSLALKSAFAVVGMAVLVEVVTERLFGVRLTDFQLRVIAASCCLAFTVLNVVSVKHTGRFQVVLVAVLLVILALFTVVGVGAVQPRNFSGFMERGWGAVFSTAGLVFVSFGGLTKVASVAEEVKNPGRNLPGGMILAWFVVTGFYLAVITITVGVLGQDGLVTVVDGSRHAKTHVPVSQAAGALMGLPGFGLLSFAAIAAFVTTANGGILAASRSPMAMSRDGLLPPALGRVSSRLKTPYMSVLLTGGFMIAAILFLDIESLVKTASTLMIILFILTNISVIIMRESRIQSYRPKFKSPLYPYLNIAAIVAYGALIVDMGVVPLLITVGFVVVSAVWFALYVSRRVSRASAVMHIVERVTDRELKTVTLENELRDILLERDEIVEDRFDRLIRNCKILDITGRQDSEKIFRQVSAILASKLGTSEDELFEKFIAREAEGGTVVQPGLAIPHVIVEGRDKFDVLLVRARGGITFAGVEEPVKTMFVLAGSKDQRNYHLRALMAIAQVTQEKGFEQRWLAARDIEGIRNLILLSARKRDTAQK